MTPIDLSSQARGPELSDYVALIRRRVPLIAVVTLVITVLAMGYSLTRSPLYEGTAEVVVQPILADPFATGARVDQQVVMETEVLIVRSGLVAALAANDLGTTKDPTDLLKNLDVGFPRGTQVLQIVYSDENPTDAALAARAFAEAYLQFRTNKAQDLLNDQIGALTLRLTTLQTDLDAVLADFGRPGATEGERAAANARASTLSSQISTAANELAEKQGFEVRAGEVIDLGRIPKKPASPNHSRNLMAGLLVGALLGLALAFLVDGIDPRITRPSEVEQLTGTAVLTVVPPERRGGGTGPQRDAYRRLALVLRSATTTRDVLLVASATDLPERRETTVRLAEALARMGASVLVIDANIRKPGLHDLVGIGNIAGLVDVVTNRLAFEDCVFRAPDVDGLSILPAGKLGDGPPTLLEDHSIQPIIARSRSIYDVVIIDGPAVLDAADALSLQREVDGVLIVARERHTERPHLEELQVQFDTVNAKLIGSVLHAVKRPGRR